MSESKGEQAGEVISGVLDALTLAFAARAAAGLITGEFVPACAAIP
jgi:hypothetical protein